MHMMWCSDYLRVRLGGSDGVVREHKQPAHVREAEGTGLVVRLAAKGARGKRDRVDARSFKRARVVRDACRA